MGRETYRLALHQAGNKPSREGELTLLVWLLAGNKPSRWGQKGNLPCFWLVINLLGKGNLPCLNKHPSLRGEEKERKERGWWDMGVLLNCG